MDKQNDILKIDLQGMAPLIQVFDMPTSLKFYRDILGFKVVQSSGEGDDVDWVLLELNKIELMLNTAYEKEHRPANPDQLRIAAHADTTLYFGCPDIDAAYKCLHNSGVDLKEPSITGYGWKAINFKDPDGFEICFHWPEGEN
ncbi:MAG TPA: VOC family protein [Panacibacter sp.]|nr:VOC family protein [Panacibacter sp.]